MAFSRDRNRCWIAIACLLAIAWCAAPASGEGEAWRAAHDLDHPWVGRIADLNREQWIDADTLFRELRRATFVILGEQHDHPDHHRLEARVIAELAAGGRRPAVFLEMFAIDRAPELRHYWKSGNRDLAAFYDAVSWDALGWGSRPLWRPLFETLLQLELEPRAANLPRSTPRDRMPTSHELAPTHASALAEVIRNAHCGVLDESGVARMVAVQRARDARLALSLEGHHAPQRILVTGQGHARRDRGVPYQLRVDPREDRAGIATLHFASVDPERRGEPDYRELEEMFSADFVWWTPRHDLRDPCERFRESLEALRKKQAP